MLLKVELDVDTCGRYLDSMLPHTYHLTEYYWVNYSMIRIVEVTDGIARILKVQVGHLNFRSSLTLINVLGIRYMNQHNPLCIQMKPESGHFLRKDSELNP